MDSVYNNDYFDNHQTFDGSRIFHYMWNNVFLLLLIPVSIKLGKRKSYIDIALNNCKQFQIAEDTQQFAETVDASLNNAIVYKSHLVVATDEFLLLWGADDTYFNPIVIPRKMIIKSEVVYRKKGIYGSSRRTNVMGVFTLSNDIKVEALLCGQFEKKALIRLEKCGIVSLETNKNCVTGALKMEYIINGKKLVWDYYDYDDASRLKDNNLHIDNIWNMKDTVGYTDTCVGVSILADDTFYFVTFRGLGFTMKVSENTVECIKKQITK